MPRYSTYKYVRVSSVGSISPYRKAVGMSCASLLLLPTLCLLLSSESLIGVSGGVHKSTRGNRTNRWFSAGQRSAVIHPFAKSVNYVFGGQRATTGLFPYQVSVQVNHKSFCGGGIIAEDLVLTAAHCVMKENREFYDIQYDAVAGSVNLNEGFDTFGGLDVEMVYVPRKFNPATKLYDIAILKLKTALDLNLDFLKKLNLPAENNTYANLNATVGGYGYNWINVYTNPETGKKIEGEGSANGYLNYGFVRTLSNEECQKKFHRKIIASSYICGYIEQKVDSRYSGLCSGDSGGPLVVNGDTVIGVVSMSPLGCDESVKPALYTRVSSHLDFVRGVMNGTFGNDVLVHTYPTMQFQNLSEPIEDLDYQWPRPHTKAYKDLRTFYYAIAYG